MLFAGKEVRIGKNCARGLEYSPRLQAKGCAEDRGHSFSNMDRPRPAINMFIFFLSGKLLLIIRNICVDFLLKQFHTVRMHLAFRSSKPMLQK